MMPVKINTIYGIIVDTDKGVDMPYYRFSNVSRSSLPAAAKSYLDMLLPADIPINVRMATADTIIRLLQASDGYEKFVSIIDPVNTYDIDCRCGDNCDSLSFDVLYKWASALPLAADDMHIEQTDDPITTVQKALWIILSVV